MRKHSIKVKQKISISPSLQSEATTETVIKRSDDILGLSLKILPSCCHDNHQRQFFSPTITNANFCYLLLRDFNWNCLILIRRDQDGVFPCNKHSMKQGTDVWKIPSLTRRLEHFPKYLEKATEKIVQQTHNLSLYVEISKNLLKKTHSYTLDSSTYLSVILCCCNKKKKLYKGFLHICTREGNKAQRGKLFINRFMYA